MIYLSKELKGISNIEDARNKLINLKANIDKKIAEILSKYNINQKYESNYGYNYFPEKKFENNNYKSGYYESLLISLGQGLGDNFWCLLFPPLCLLDYEENDNITYSSFIKELFS